MIPGTKWVLGLSEGDTGDAGMIANQGIREAVVAVPRQQEYPAFRLKGGTSSQESILEYNVKESIQPSQMGCVPGWAWALGRAASCTMKAMVPASRD